jgi:galactokinase/mevalonate kinase-like predicted kinase
VPKGSGLGTSSIWRRPSWPRWAICAAWTGTATPLFTRTLALEQMLTTGGGWQDQAGAIFRGIKLIETAPGLVQKPAIRWLPHHLFDHDYANRSILLYYTGITRLAKNILAEIVRGIFLNSPRTWESSPTLAPTRILPRGHSEVRLRNAPDRHPH